MTTRLTSVVIDAAQPGVLAHWWSEAIGWPITFDAPDEVVVEPAGNGQSYDVPALEFVHSDDPKTTKNRVHLDLSPEDETREEAVGRAVELGATVLADHRKPDGSGWVVLADPEGNEFCLERGVAERGPRPAASFRISS